MLDDHFGDWNWKKIVGLGISLLLKIRDALAEKAEHEMTFEEFNTAITPIHRSVWLAEMKSWEDNPNDTTISNPLEAKSMCEYSILFYGSQANNHLGITQAGAQLKLAELEAKELQQGIDTSLHPEISHSMLIASSIDLEEEQ